MRQGRECHLRAVAWRVPRSVVVSWTRSRSRCTRHVSLQRFMRRHPLRSPGSLGRVPPLRRYYEALRLPDSPSRRTSFPSLGDTLERLRFVPVRPQTRGRRIILEFAVPVAPGPVFFRGTVRISHVPVKPVRSFAMFLRPRCDQAAHLGQGQVCLARPPRLTKTRAHDKEISGLNHTAFDLAVYASQ